MAALDPLMLNVGALAMAVCAVWWRPPRWPFAWTAGLLVALAVSLATGVLAPTGCAALGALWLAAAWLARLRSGAAARGAHSAEGASIRPCTRVATCLLAILVAVLGLSLALHQLPGFTRMVLVDGVRLSPESVPFFLTAHADKALAGVILLAYLAPRAANWRTCGRAFHAARWPLVLTPLATMAAAWASGAVQFVPKLPAQAPMFLVVNLCFVCAAEEAFFRGVIQAPLAAWSARWLRGEAGRVILCGALFGLAHAPGGVAFASFAALAGTGYAWAFSRARCVEPAIAAHFATNALHFFCFSYPAAA